MAGARSFGSFYVTSPCNDDTAFLCQFRFTECPTEVPTDDWIGICRVGWRSPQQETVEKCRVCDGEIFGRQVMLRVPSAPLPHGQYQYVYVCGTGEILAYSEPITVGSLHESASTLTSQSIDSVGLELGNTAGNQGGRQRWIDRCRLASRVSEFGESDELGQLKEDVLAVYEFVSEMQFKLLNGIERAKQKRESDALAKEDIEEKRTKEVSGLEEQIAGLSLETKKLRNELDLERTERHRLQEENDRLKAYESVVRSYFDDTSKSEAQVQSNTGSSAMSTAGTTAEREVFLSQSSESLIQGDVDSLRLQMNGAPQLYSRYEQPSDQNHMTLPPSMPLRPVMEQEHASNGSSSGSQPSQQSTQWQRNFRAEYTGRSNSVPVITSSGSTALVTTETPKAAALPGANYSEYIPQSSEVRVSSQLFSIQRPQSYPDTRSHLSEDISQRQISYQASVAETTHHSLEAALPLIPEATTEIGTSMARHSRNDLSRHSGGNILTCPICDMVFADNVAGHDALAYHADGHFTN